MISLSSPYTDAPSILVRRDLIEFFPKGIGPDFTHLIPALQTLQMGSPKVLLVECPLELHPDDRTDLHIPILIESILRIWLIIADPGSGR